MCLIIALGKDVGLGVGWLGLMTIEIFSNLNDCTIVSCADDDSSVWLGSLEESSAAAGVAGCCEGVFREHPASCRGQPSSMPCSEWRRTCLAKEMGLLGKCAFGPKERSGPSIQHPAHHRQVSHFWEEKLFSSSVHDRKPDIIAWGCCNA